MTIIASFSITVTIEELVNSIVGHIPGAEVFARDLTGEGNHFEAVVVSDRFRDLSLLKRQQLVMNPMAELFRGPLHALTIKTYTPQEWEKV
jgi:acid stress-induced BolA-like protein IbaG/YrbA